MTTSTINNAVPAPIDTAVAFTNLYRRWSNDACELTEQCYKQTCGLVGAYVADVLSLWDEGAHAWFAGAPTILRLESCDVAAFTMREPYIALFFGSIETDSPVATFGAGGHPSPTAGSPCALTWRSMRPCSYAIGRKLSKLTFERDSEGCLVALEARLDDGGCLRITAAGIDCASAASDGKHAQAQQHLARAV